MSIHCLFSDLNRKSYFSSPNYSQSQEQLKHLICISYSPWISSHPNIFSLPVHLYKKDTNAIDSFHLNALLFVVPVACGHLYACNQPEPLAGRCLLSQLTAIVQIMETVFVCDKRDHGGGHDARQISLQSFIKTPPALKSGQRKREMAHQNCFPHRGRDGAHAAASVLLSTRCCGTHIKCSLLIYTTTFTIQNPIGLISAQNIIIHFRAA